MSKGKTLLQGIPKGLGVVVGKCIIVLSPEDAIKIEYGDIIVMGRWSRPEYIPHESNLAKAAALIENEYDIGGYGRKLMSNKYHKPCISGTIGISKLKATDVLQDGQEVMLVSPSGQVEKPSDTGKILLTVGTVYEYIDDGKL